MANEHCERLLRLLPPQDPKRDRFKLILNCVMIITSVIPPGMLVAQAATAAACQRHVKLRRLMNDLWQIL